MRPTQDEILMQTAEVISQRGTCSRLSVGAVLARDGRILSTGYNGAASGLPHCDHTDTGSTGCTRSVHAEVNALAFAAKHGVRVEGSALFTTHSPCLNCSYLIINTGVNRVVYQNLYTNDHGLNLLEMAGVVVQSMETESPLTELELDQ